MVVAVKVTGVCHGGHQKQLAVKVAEGGGLLEELDGMLEVGGGGGGHQHSDAGRVCGSSCKAGGRDGSQHSQFTLSTNMLKTSIGIYNNPASVHQTLCIKVVCKEIKPVAFKTRLICLTFS